MPVISVTCNEPCDVEKFNDRAKSAPVMLDGAVVVPVGVLTVALGFAGF